MSTERSLASFTAFEDADGEDSRPLYGPVRLLDLSEHRWMMEAGTEGLDPHVSLICMDPCAIPYCYHSGKVCSCQWAPTAEQSMDVHIEVEVKLTHEDHSGWNYWGDDYEPGWLKAVPA